MGSEVSKNTRAARPIFASLIIGFVATSCGAVAAASIQPPAASVDPPSANFSAALAECDRPEIVLGPAPATSAISRTAAEMASGAAGARGPADVALLTTVTVGTQTGHIATPANALRDLAGAPIINRPAWVFVFRNQAVKIPGGMAPISRQATAPSPKVVAVLATVVDAQTGTFLRGWGCGFGN